jgi:hypothetical protein
MKVLLLLGVVAAVWAPQEAMAQQSPDKVLEEAEAEFRQQHHRRAVALLRPLLYPIPKLKNADDIHRTREMLGASYWQLNEHIRAEREWQFLLIARPEFKLDSFYYPKTMREFFEKLRKTLIQQGVIKKAVQVKQKKRLPSVLRITQIVERRSRASAFIPFGVGQFETGSKSWGWFFLSTESAALLTAIGTSFAYQFLPTTGRPFTYTDEVRPTANALYWTSLISGAVFVGLATWGIIDANIRHEPVRVVRIEERMEIPTRTVNNKPPQPNEKPSSKPVKTIYVNAPAAGGSQ